MPFAFPEYDAFRPVQTDGLKREPLKRLVQAGGLLQLLELGVSQPLQMANPTVLSHFQRCNLSRRLGEVDDYLPSILPRLDGLYRCVVSDGRQRSGSVRCDVP